MKRSSQTKRIGVLFLFILLLLGVNFYKKEPTPTSGKDNVQAIEQAFENHRSNIQVSGNGIIVKLLPDDTKGTRHQRFIVRVSPKVTVLIAHNIDLAPRINTIAKGDTLSFYGEYEWNNRGGVIHWTHHDPGRRHIDGWLKFQGKVYQ